MRATRSERLDILRAEARYRRERLELYKARIYAGRGSSDSKLRELERSADGAAARVHRAEQDQQAPSPGG